MFTRCLNCKEWIYILEKNIEDIDAGEELLLDRKKQSKAWTVFQGLFAMFALVFGLVLLNTPGVKIIDGLTMLILSLFPMIMFMGYRQKADLYDLLLKLNRINAKKTHTVKKKPTKKKEKESD